MKAATIILAVLGAVCRMHVTLPGSPVAIPVPALVVLAELAVIAAVVWHLGRQVARGPRRLSPYPVRRFT